MRWSIALLVLLAGCLGISANESSGDWDACRGHRYHAVGEAPGAWDAVARDVHNLSIPVSTFASPPRFDETLDVTSVIQKVTWRVDGGDPWADDMGYQSRNGRIVSAEHLWIASYDDAAVLMGGVLSTDRTNEEATEVAARFLDALRPGEDNAGPAQALAAAARTIVDGAGDAEDAGDGGTDASEAESAPVLSEVPAPATGWAVTRHAADAEHPRVRTAVGHAGIAREAWSWEVAIPAWYALDQTENGLWETHIDERDQVRLDFVARSPHNETALQAAVDAHWHVLGVASELQVTDLDAGSGPGYWCEPGNA